MTHSPLRLARLFITLAIAFLALDSIWLTLMASRLYRPVLGPLMRAEFEVVAAVAFYVIYFIGLIAFAILPSMNVRDAARRGAAFGFVAYATYDLTNQATLVVWRWPLTFADLAWGAIASALACAVTRRLNPVQR